MRRWFWIMAAAWVGLLLTWWVLEKLLLTDEKRILQQIDVMRLAVQNGKTMVLADNISQDFEGVFDSERFDKRTMIGAVVSLRRQYPDLQVFIDRTVIRVQGDEAQANVTGRAIDKLDVIEEGEFRLKFSKRNNSWLLSGLAQREQTSSGR